MHRGLARAQFPETETEAEISLQIERGHVDVVGIVENVIALPAASTSPNFTLAEQVAKASEGHIKCQNENRIQTETSS